MILVLSWLSVMVFAETEQANENNRASKGKKFEFSFYVNITLCHVFFFFSSAHISGMFNMNLDLIFGYFCGMIMYTSATE